MIHETIEMTSAKIQGGNLYSSPRYHTKIHATAVE